MISARALKSTREGACAPLAVLNQETQPVAFLVVGTQGTEQAQARTHGVHIGLLHPVIQLQIREAAAGGLDESLVMLQNMVMLQNTGLAL